MNDYKLRMFVTFPGSILRLSTSTEYSLIYFEWDVYHLIVAAERRQTYRSNDVWHACSVTCSADDESTGYLQGIYVLLKSSGTVVWPIPIRLRTSCKVDITYFPFDDQLCTLLFGSSVYSHWRVAFNVSLTRCSARRLCICVIVNGH